MTPTEQKLREALGKARVIIVAHNEAEHMWDGFGPRTHQGSDDLLIEIDAALAAPSAGETALRCRECGQPNGNRHHSGCTYDRTSPYVIAAQCTTPTKPVETGGADG